MPWDLSNPPPPAKNWPEADQRKCIEAANAVLADGGTDSEAVYACIRAAGRSEHSEWGEPMQDSFLIPTEDAADNVLIFPIGKFYRDGVERTFTPDDAALMVQNFKEAVLGETRLPPINREHKRELGKVGSIVDIWQAEDGVRGKTDGDLSGFDYLSPEVRWEWVNPYTGVAHRNVLMGAAATNYPFFLDKMALNNDAALLWTGSDWEPFQDTKRDQLKEAQSSRAERYSIGVKGGGALTPPKGYPNTESEYGDPVNYRYPADAEHAQAAVSYFNQSKNKSAGGYSDAEWSIIGKRLARLVGRHLKASYKYEDGALVRGDEEMTDEQETRGHIMPEEITNAPEPQATEDYAELFAAMQEEFAEVKAELESEKKRREAVEEKFAESEKARRLMHFTDVASALAVSDEPEQFAEDLYELEKFNSDITERMIARMRALTNAVEQGELFAQKSKAKAPEAGDPYMTRVEAVRREKFSEQDPARGWVLASEVVAKESPELVQDFAERTRGGD